jgi:hypothetical protein
VTAGALLSAGSVSSQKDFIMTSDDTTRVHAGIGETIAAFVLALTVVGLCLALLVLAPSVHRSPVLHYVVISYLVIRLLMLSYNPNAAASLLMLHWFTLFGAMLPLLFQYQGDSFYYTFMASLDFDILGPIAVVALLLICVDLGHYLAANQTFRSQPKKSPTVRRLSLHSVLLLLVVANVLIAGSIRHFGLDYLRASRLEQYLDYETDGPGYFLFDITMRLMLYWSFVLAAIVTRHAVVKNGLLHSRTLLCLTVLLVAAVEIAVFSSPLSTPRFLLLSLVFMMIMAFTDFASAFLRLGLVTGAAAALYLVFPVLGSASRTDDIVWVMDRAQLTEYLSHLDFDNGAQLLMGYRFALEQGFSNGLNVLSAVLVLVPRSIWPQKSEGVGAAIITYFGGTFPNVSAPLYLEFFIDFGFTGVALYSLAFGYLLGRVNQAATRAGRYSVPWMLNIALFATMPLLVRGAVMTGTVALYAHVIAAIVWIAVSRWSRPTAEPA